MVDIWSNILEKTAEQLPPFNDYLLKDFKQDQINRCPSFMEMTFNEATRLFPGNVKFVGSRILTPEERINHTLNNPKYNMSVEIAQTEMSLMEFKFLYENNPFNIYLYMPYLKDNAMTINGSKYYLQFALTDRVFYHIQRENGLGIKVLRAHLRFWRNLRYQYCSMSGIRYADHVLVVKAHLREHRCTSEDIKSALILYSLSLVGFDATLSKYGVNPAHIRFVESWDQTDTEFEYFMVRKADDDNPGLYAKVHKSILSTNPNSELKTSMRVITALMYVVQYFVRCTSTIYTNNTELIKYLMSPTDFSVWQVILGKTIYGINYASETQVCAHAEQHLESLLTYLDPHTKSELADVGCYCENIYDLLDYVFINMDVHVLNHTPANVAEKRLNTIGLLCGNLVRKLFVKVYGYTNNCKKSRVIVQREVEALFRIGVKAFAQIHTAGPVVAINPANYNDNYLLAVGARKMRATHSAAGSRSSDLSGSKGGKTSANHLSSPEHRFHSSWMYVESCLTVSHQHPDAAGNINVFCEIDQNGNILVPDYGEDFHTVMTPYLITK